MRRLSLAGALLLLGGCNMMMTTEPLFTRADALGAPGLRPGVWNGPADPACPFDERSPMAAWPGCANGGVVTDARIRPHQDMNGASLGADYVLARGDPRILQLHGLEPAPGSGLSVAGYFYAGLRPTRTDPLGRITAYEAWLVICGPPPPRGADSGGEKATRRPPRLFPGLVMDPSGQSCTAGSPSVLRAAAAASRKWATGALAAHWVRDGAR